MKKILLLLFIPIVCFGQNQYKSSIMRFIYPNEYKQKSSRIIQDVNVKLVNKDYSQSENIIVNITNEYSSISDVDKQNHINQSIKEVELAAKALNSKYESKVLNYETKTIYGKNVITTLIKSNIIDYDIVLYQLQYLYVKKGKVCYIIVSYDEENDYSHIADFILKDFKFL